MRLKKWLKEHQMSQAAFAKVIRTDQAHVSDLVNGKVSPKMDTVFAIEKATKGDVAYVDWVSKK